MSTSVSPSPCYLVPRGHGRKLELSNKIIHDLWTVKFWTETVVYQIDRTSKLSLAAALNPNQADGLQKKGAWRAAFRYLSWPPVALKKLSGPDLHTHHHFGSIVLGFFFVLFSVWWDVVLRVGMVGESVFTVYLLHAWAVWKLCVGQTPRLVLVCGRLVCGARYSSIRLRWMLRFRTIICLSRFLHLWSE